MHRTIITAIITAPIISGRSDSLSSSSPREPPLLLLDEDRDALGLDDLSLALGRLLGDDLEEMKRVAQLNYEMHKENREYLEKQLAQYPKFPKWLTGWRDRLSNWVMGMIDDDFGR